MKLLQHYAFRGINSRFLGAIVETLRERASLNVVVTYGEQYASSYFRQ